VAIAILVAVAGFLATSRSVRRGVGLSPGTAADRESLWSWTELWRAWRRRLAHLRRRWLRQVRIGVAPAGSGRSRGDPDTRERAGGPRALYRRLLALGRESGLTRIPAQTPQEYLGAWREALPGPEEAGILTAAYERARYGQTGDGQTEGAGSRADTELRPVLDRLARRLAQLERG
jgi:hypothetical protein